MVESHGIAMVIGPGAVTLAQGPVFQYLAARECRHLRRMGFRVVAIEDNPATMMDCGDSGKDLYAEPALPEVVEQIVERYGAMSIWYGMAGRRGWNLAMRLAGEGWYEGLGLETPGLEDRMLWLCGDRSILRETLEARGISNPAFNGVRSMREGQEAAERLGFPLVVRPHFSCGGWGAGMAYNPVEYPMLLEEAMRESITGEVLVEEALDGWSKYLAFVLRDAQGASCVMGIIQQVEPLPVHDEDAVLLYPPHHLGRDGAYALGEMAREVAEALDLLGVVELKLAVDPAWESLYVIDVNPWPWRNTPFMETVLGMDMLRDHMHLVMGKHIPAEYKSMQDRKPGLTTIAVPRAPYRLDSDAEGYRALACMSMGKRVFMRENAAEAASEALRTVCEEGWEDARAETLHTLKTRLQVLRRKAPAQITRREQNDDETSWPLCIARTAEGGLDEGLFFVGGDNGITDGGFDHNVNCLHALEAWRNAGGKAALYTPDPGFALLACESADAVFVGSMLPREMLKAATQMGMSDIVLHYGGPKVFSCAQELQSGGKRVIGGGFLSGGTSQRRALEMAASAGLPVVEFYLSEDAHKEADILQKQGYPMLATIEKPGGEPLQSIIYTREDAEALQREHAEEKILWRPLCEEAQEVQVEAVGRDKEDHIVVLWEQVDEIGICSSDGLAVFPPYYLTSGQSEQAANLAESTIEALGWRGNLSMRMMITDGDIRLWGVCPGPSNELPFLYRATSIPLAALGVMALCGRAAQAHRAEEPRSAVRAPIIPYSVIASRDILPSPQRRSTGTVMGLAADPGAALAKALWSQGLRPRPGGRALLSVANREKRRAILLARELQEAGYVLMATRGTAQALAAAGIGVEIINKLREGRPNIIDLIRNGQVDLVINIPRGKYPQSDGFYIRAESVRHAIPCITNMEVALVLVRGLREADSLAWGVRSLRDYGRFRQEVGGG